MIKMIVVFSLFTAVLYCSVLYFAEQNQKLQFLKHLLKWAGFGILAGTILFSIVQVF